MKHESSQQGKRDRDAPHAHGQAVEVEDRVSAAVQHAVDRDGIDAAADHINRHDDHHPGEIASGFIGQNHHPHDQRSHRQHQGRGGKADDPGDVLELDAVGLASLQLARAEGVAHHDAGSAADAVACTADQITHHGGNRVARRGIRPHMAHDGRIGCKADAPEERRSQQRQALPDEVLPKLLLPLQETVPCRTDISFPGRNPDTQSEFNHAGKGSGQCCPAGVHARKAEKTENENGIQDDVCNHRRRADPCNRGNMVGELHHCQIALRDSGQQIGPSGDS